MAEFRKTDAERYTKVLKETTKRYSDNNKRIYALRVADEYVEWEKWTTRDCLNIGLKLLDILISTTGLIELHTISRNNKTVTKVTPTPEALKYLEERAGTFAFLRPVYEPMVVKPKHWTTPYNGGYISRAIRPLRLVKRGSRAYFKNLESADMPIVYAAVNAMQDTPWQVNTFVLEVMLHFWEQGSSIGGLPPREGKPIPPKPFDIETNEEARKAWRKKAADVHEINIANRSKLIQFGIVLDIAKRYKDYKRIYMPYQLDFRGRVYAVPALNCQGSDVTKSLLRFAHGKPLGSEGWKWLAIHGAGLVGNDKVSFEERINFIFDQEDVIRAIAEDPYTNRQWAGTIGGFEVDCPWEFLAWCKEWVGFLDYGESYVSKIPVAMDGSCSGLQHYSAMLRDEVAGAAVNLVPASKPSDVYKMVAEKVKTALEHDLEHGTEDRLELIGDEPKLFEGTKNLAKQWIEFGITRKVTKRAVMTLCYGSKRYGFSEQLMEDFIKKGKMKGEILPFTGSGKKACNYLAEKIWNSKAGGIDRIDSRNQARLRGKALKKPDGIHRA